MLDAHEIGLMCQPASNKPRPGWLWAADNGCFAAKWECSKWLRWLSSSMPRSGCLFATVPDVVADHAATLARWKEFAPRVAELRYPLAFVGQDGATSASVPWGEFDAWFVGGSTEWKQGEQSRSLAVEASSRGKWVHVGRVNSARRVASWRGIADSVDGTYIAFGPEKNAPRVREWMRAANMAPSLFG